VGERDLCEKARIDPVENMRDLRAKVPVALCANEGLSRTEGCLRVIRSRCADDLLELVRGRCQVARPDDLTLREASALIDSLKPAGDQPAG
jgi:hypothetical protein